MFCPLCLAGQLQRQITARSWSSLLPGGVHVAPEGGEPPAGIQFEFGPNRFVDLTGTEEGKPMCLPWAGDR